MTDGYKVTRLDPNKDYSAEIEWSKKIKVGPYEETQVIYGEGCMTNTPDFPALVELASRLKGKDKKTCELALYTLKKQDERIAKLQRRIDYLESMLIDKEVRISGLESLVDARVKMYDDVLSASVKTVNKLREALQPFANIAIGMDASGNEFPDEWLLGHNCLLVGDARKAKSALEGK